MSSDFVHLHLHTEYSLLDGAVRIKEVMKKAKEYDMPAVAKTDHGNLYGTIEFYQAAKAAGIKPIIGCEAYMAPGSHKEKQASSARDAAYHFTLLAKDLKGYHNLIKLTSAAHLDGYYYKPRIDKELLSQYSEGLIGLSGCLKGEINQALQNDQIDKARAGVAEFRDILGAENFFLELHDHGMEVQKKCNRALPALAKEFGLGLVAANDVHFLERAHHEAHDVMICIGTGSMVQDEKRMRYTPELYFKSPAEMRGMFGEIPESLSNTMLIAEMCNLELDLKTTRYPIYEPPEGKTREQYLRELSYEGFHRKYGEKANEPEMQERLERELLVLENAGFTSYFLITWDFINWAKEHGIPVGPGRGSAAGSMVAYVLGITECEPIRFGLLFERFLNPERVSPPDIDVDFCEARRGEVIDYVRRKYGERQVSQIITFGKLKAKSVVRDVGRVMGLSYGEGDRIAKMIPNDLGITLKGYTDKDGKYVQGAIDKNPELKQAVENEPVTRQLFEYGSFLEGLPRNPGVHAAAVVIGQTALDEVVPLSRAGKDNDVIVTQYAMGAVGDIGLLKMDFLALKNLTVIDDAVKLIKRKIPDFSEAQIPLDDAATYELLNRGETVGIFQLESGGMVNLCKRFGITSIEDILALIALYRPGPMSLIDDYIARKKGTKKIKYQHPLLEKVCSETYGIMIYQEQVMQAARVLGGYTLGGADLLRRAMGKKDKEKMATERQKFIVGCAEKNGIPAKKANEIFDLLEMFAGYGFNKSHSAAYALITNQTAFLKANYPVEFMAASLSNEVDNTEKISVFVGECKRMGVPILPPDVNLSSQKFASEKLDETGREGIRFGLAAIKNVGGAAMQAAIEEREANGEFRSLDDFCQRLDPRKINKKVLESLVRCGAFDWTGVERAELFVQIDNVLASAASAHRDRASGQVSLFGDFEMPAEKPKQSVANHVVPWAQAEKLAAEKELLGFYVTGHPLDEFRTVLESEKFTPIRSLAEVEDKTETTLGGALVVVDKKFTKKEGKPFAVVTLEDLTGALEVMIWNDVFNKCSEFLARGKVVSISGRVDKREETARMVAQEVLPLKTGEKPVILTIPREGTTEMDLFAIERALRQSPGVRAMVFQFVGENGERVRMNLGAGYQVSWTPELQAQLAPWLPGT